MLILYTLHNQQGYTIFIEKLNLYKSRIFIKSCLYFIFVQILNEMLIRFIITQFSLHFSFKMIADGQFIK
jgi:hypothetical protein